ncbi:MAG TPA: hypothetical protein DCQ83_06365, partial [Fibrobacteres bacterium]|nr:hypothetical protein [Fibrobacterota bacterium]
MFPFLRSASLLLLALVLPVLAEKPQVLQTPHYRILYAKKYEPIAGEVLKVAEGVWPTLAKAYDAYSNYQTIDIFLLDPGDYANGEAVYPYSRVEIFVPHLNWVMRGRANWIGNVAAHEIAHVFSLRQKARLWIFSDATIGGGTINKEWNWSFLLPWVPLPAPNWWIEGIAQFESEAAGYDTWDSQRDMIVRDAWLTHSLPTLGEIETFDGEWIQGERVYNTGFAFLRYLRDRYGIDKVRQLAVPKPLFHFGGAVVAVYGKTLTELYSEWQASLAEHYGSFEELGRDTLFDRDIQGSFTQNLAFSPDGRTIAWLGNGDRDYALNWIYWKDTGDVTTRSGEPVMGEQGKAPGLHRNAQASTWGETQGAPQFWNNGTNPVLKRLPTTLPRNFSERRTDPPGTGRSDEISSTGLEFNHDGTRLLTTRNDWYSTYNDIWEYELHAALKSESEKWHRLTWNIRASYASYHPTQSHTIVFSKFDEGSSNVAILDSAGRV